jgi:peroxiredoxin
MMSNFTFLLVSLFLSGSLIINAQSKLPVGSKAPAFKAPDEKGQMIELSALLKDGPVIINFYRGQWCGHCTMQMAFLQDSLHLIHELGATLVAITPERSDEVEITRRKSNARFIIIPDLNNKIMNDYQVTWKMSWGLHAIYRIGGINLNKANASGERKLPVPATYIIGADGRILHAFYEEDHTKRMWANEMLDVLKKYNSQ